MKNAKPELKLYKNLAVAKAVATIFKNKSGVEFNVVTKKGGGFNVVEADKPVAKVAAKKAPVKAVAKASAKKGKLVKPDIDGLVAALAS